jgi:hypothetical protein
MRELANPECSDPSIELTSHRRAAQRIAAAVCTEREVMTTVATLGASKFHDRSSLAWLPGLFLPVHIPRSWVQWNHHDRLPSTLNRGKSMPSSGKAHTILRNRRSIFAACGMVPILAVTLGGCAPLWDWVGGNFTGKPGEMRTALSPSTSKPGSDQVNQLISRDVTAKKAHILALDAHFCHQN